jgi:hypothetical protein
MKMRTTKLARAWLTVGLGLWAFQLGLAGGETPESHTHQPLRLRNGQFFVEAEGQSPRVDDLTAFCLGCHQSGQGETRGQDRPATARLPAHDLGPVEGNHPVDVAYPEEKPGYVALDSLDSRILLSDGHLTCVSCHRPQTPDHALVMPTEQGELCQACHVV